MARLDKIVIVITGDPTDNVRSTRGDYAKIIAEAIGDGWDGPYRTLDARVDPLDPVKDSEAIIISGSSANVHTREPWMQTTEAWLREAVRGGRAVLGLCFGHQLLAQALGGEVGPNPKGREIGTVNVDRLADDPLLSGLGNRFLANACHVDTVERVPPGASVLARSNADPHQALRFGERAWGVQFHPEFDGNLIRQFIEARSDAMRAEGLDPERTLKNAADTPGARQVMRNFLRTIRG